MSKHPPLEACLPSGSPLDRAVAETISCLARGAITLAGLVARGPLESGLGADLGAGHVGGDAQKRLDVLADELFFRELADAPVALVASEEREGVAVLRERAPLAVAIDPIDGSSNIDVNAPVGAIFSILPAVPGDAPEATFLRPGSSQIAAGIVVFGPTTAMLLTTGVGVDLHVLDHETGAFRRAQTGVRVPHTAREFAVNASNRRHWPAPLQMWFDDCLAGRDGPLGENHNMRWIASLVAETYRIFNRGGVYLYPADERPGYARGRLRQVYEANPIAFLTEQAGGHATDGLTRMLDLAPPSLHARCPLVFGSAEMVETIAGYLRRG